METHLRAELVLAALEMAIGQRTPPQRPTHPVYIADVRRPLPGSWRAPIHGICR